MPPRWTFYDFIDEHGVNQIERWVASLPRSHRTDVRAALRGRFEAHQNTDLKPQQFKPLHAPCEGLIEIRFKVGGIPYRPLGFTGPESGEFTILIGAKEHNGHLVPEGVCQSAFARIDLARQPNRRHIQRHDYGRTA